MRDLIDFKRVVIIFRHTPTPAGVVIHTDQAKQLIDAWVRRRCSWQGLFYWSWSRYVTLINEHGVPVISIDLADVVCMYTTDPADVDYKENSWE